ncbi:MAG: hypothetical protein FD180_800 [Planctomycetota bacterium]|nr:MAG: hypothetical protein FD180_800 [Planctomycetota bacterium]
MTTRHLACALATLAFLTSAARSEESLEELKARLQKNWEPWKGCEPGSWFQTRSKSKTGTSDTETETRQTLVSRDEKGLTVETRTVKRKTDEQGDEVVEFGDPTNSTIPAAQQLTYENLKELPREAVEVEGKKIDCRVIELEYVYKYPQPVAGQTEWRTKMTCWISPVVKEMGGIVKTEGDSDNQGMMGAQSFDMKMVAAGKEVKIGDATVKCSVYKYGNSTGKEEMTSAGELWMSEDVPFGYAKMKMQSNYGVGASKMHMEMETEITGMEIVKAKTE